MAWPLAQSQLLCRGQQWSFQPGRAAFAARRARGDPRRWRVPVIFALAYSCFVDSPCSNCAGKPRSEFATPCSIVGEFARRCKRQRHSNGAPVSARQRRRESSAKRRERRWHRSRCRRRGLCYWKYHVERFPDLPSPAAWVAWQYQCLYRKDRRLDASANSGRQRV